MDTNWNAEVYAKKWAFFTCREIHQVSFGAPLKGHSDLRSRCGLCHLQPFHYEESGVTRHLSLDIVKPTRADLRLVLRQMINMYVYIYIYMYM